MAESYAIVNTELMSATDDRSRMRSFRYGVEGSGNQGPTYKDIQNGSIVTLTKLLDRDLWMAVDCKAATPLEEIVLVTSPEIMYDERKRSLHEFVNEAGVNATGMLLKKDDIFSVTIEALDAASTLAVGNLVEAQAGTKLKVVASATASSTRIGKIIDIVKRGSETYYGILVG